MEKIRILHTADIHIGAAESFLGREADSRRFETLITFEKIMDLAVKAEIQVVAIAGDLFDSNRVEERFFDAFFNKISALPQIKVIFAAGNHDPLNSESPFLNRDLPENLYVLGVKDECITFEDLKLCVYGRSFENTYLKGEEKFSIAPNTTEYINLMVQHGELKNDINSDYNAITPKFVKYSGMDYIALGHVHKKTEIGRIDNTFFAYCGCPEGQGFDELDQKGVYIGEIGKGICELEFVPVAKRQHIHYKANVSQCRDNGEICTMLINTLKNEYGDDYADNLYKIELIGEIPPETEIITAEIESRLKDLLYFVKVKDSTEFLLDLKALSEETSLKGMFVKKMLSKIESAEEDNKEIYKNALKLGIKAFVSEVKYSED